jgi:hypothetical protein
MHVFGITEDGKLFVNKINDGELEGGLICRAPRWNGNIPS